MLLKVRELGLLGLKGRLLLLEHVLLLGMLMLLRGMLMLSMLMLIEVHVLHDAVLHGNAAVLAPVGHCGGVGGDVQLGVGVELLDVAEALAASGCGAQKGLARGVKGEVRVKGGAVGAGLAADVAQKWGGCRRRC